LKKPSDANRDAKPLNPPIFFLDASLGKSTIADMLRQAGERVEIHDAHFSPGTPDEVWLKEVGRRGWVVLTKDANIRYHPLEKQAIQTSNVIAVILTKGNLKAEDMGMIFVKALPRIKRLVQKTKFPFIARLTPAGSLSLITL
jgi:predicted nuclease of predicted toxin-antitoxin system